MCEGVVLLKQWKQGNTWCGKTIKRPLEIEVFFLQTNYFFKFSISFKVFIKYNDNVLLDMTIMNKKILWGDLICLPIYF